MRLSPKLSVLVVLLLLIQSQGFSVEGAGAPPTGFRNFKWGARPSGKLVKRSSHPDGTSMYVPAARTKLAPLYGVPVAEEAYLFSNGKFYSGMSWVDGYGNFLDLKSALLKEFGKPSFENDEQFLWKWKWPGSRVEIHLYYSLKGDRTTVTLVNNGI